MSKNVNLLNQRKIHIIGSVGSGKTTLARQLSERLSIPYYELDNVVWRRFEEGDIKRSEQDRNQNLNEIIHSSAWIIEGVHTEWVDPSFKQANVILFLDTPYSRRIYRIVKRFVLQKLVIEKSNYRPTFKIFMNMFIWNSYFEKETKPRLLQHLQNVYGSKAIIIRNTKELERMNGVLKKSC